MADAAVPATLARRLLAEVRARREEAARMRSPVAIVGMACRFPGGPDPASFWRGLAAGECAVTRGRPDGPAHGAAGAASPPWGAYVPGLDLFDAEFFGIAPLEAEWLDPQQRLLLEVSWEALEDAGLDPRGLAGSRTGVYAGIISNEYGELAPLPEADPVRGFHQTTGALGSIAAGRVAFTLGLQGPAIAVDTACSSSLVTLHQAAVALQRSEVDLALAGGVNAILLPEVSQLFLGAGMLAPDGRCKTFDAAADGYVRGEGCGMVVMKRLADAERAGDRVLGVLRGSAVNHDGASAGLTVPNGSAQERVIADALERAGVGPASVDYLEAHGTGTELGDPIELRAAAAAYGRDRPPERPLLIGSVKTNVGHLESAAGVAGVIKVLLAMQADAIPPHLHLDRPNPRLDWERLPLRVTTGTTPWPRAADRPRRAAVSSFSLSGTNAHLVLDAPPPPAASAAPAADAAPERRTERLLPLSGRTGEAVADLARRYLAWIGEHAGELTPERLADLAWVAGTGRSQFAWRAAVPFRGAADLREGLEAVSAAGGVETAPGGKVAFLFTGQGSQWAGMGRDLHEREPAARAALDRCEAVFREERGGDSLLAVMFGEREGLDRTEFTQPALYALSAGLTALWSSVGVRPDAVLGHSVGEIAAARAAGVFGLEEGMRFATRRGALMGALPAGGGMTAVFAPVGRVERLLGGVPCAEPEGTGLDIASENGAHQVVSGPANRIAALEARCAEEGLRTARLRTSHAFHSALMDPVLPEIGAAAGDRPAAAPSVPLVSNVTGRPVQPGEALDGAYWRLQARAPVAFAAGIRSLANLGVGLLVEIGPRAVLGPLAALAWPATGSGTEETETGPVVVSSLAPEAGFATAVGKAYEAGRSVSFGGLFAGETRRRLSLPTYPFQRERHWVEGPGRGGARRDAGPAADAPRELGDLLYEVRWRETAGPEGPRRGDSPPPGEGSPGRGRWVLSASRGTVSLARRVARSLRERNQEAVIAAEAPGRGVVSVERGSRDSWRGLFEGLGGDLPLAGVVHLAGAKGPGMEVSAGRLAAEVRDAVWSALALAQGLSDAALAPGLWFVTRGGQVVGESGDGAVAGSALWGIGRVLAREQPQLAARLLDLDPAAKDAAAAVTAELLFPDREDQVAYRGGRRLVARLDRLGPPAGRQAADGFSGIRGDRTYLVTGGLRGLGLVVAGWLRERGAAAVVLNARRAPGPEAAERIAELRAGGMEVRVERGDIAEAGVARRVVARSGGAGSGLPPLGGVFHCAGVMRDGALTNEDWPRFAEVLRPKVLGAWNLHRATRRLDLDAFVLFSTLMAVVGNAGQSAYASANAFLDQLALRRRRLGLAGQSIAWGPWSEVGMGARYREYLERRLGTIGVGWLTPSEGLSALDRLLEEGGGHSAVAPVEWGAFTRSVAAPQPLLDGLRPAGAWRREGIGEVPEDLPARLGAVPESRRGELLLGFVREQVRSLLRLRAAPAADARFFDLGMDSLTAVELRNRLNGALGDAYVLPDTVALDYPTAGELSRRLAEVLGALPEPPPALAVRVAEDEPIAVVGMGCRFPGGESPEAFWALLAAGEEAVRQGRPDDLMPRPPGAAPPWGGYVAGLDRFDAGFFRIAPVEAELLDPQQRLLLEVSWEALEDAGFDPGGLVGSRGGVYLGIGSNDYQHFLTDAEPSLYSATGTGFAAAGGRVAFVLGLEGPAMAVDTACSSSLVAIHQAAVALRRGEADFALAGGVNAILLPGAEKILGGSGVLSPGGRCKTFDARADGYVRGEGCGVLVLKRLSDAERDGDRMLGVLLGSAVNQDGASAGLTVPNGPAQERVIREALARAGVEASSVDYLEAHGTGTELGDPIEVQAAAAVYGEGREAERPLLLGSVKTNVGHLEAAAGVAGVVKALLAMRHGRIPPHLHFETPNPRIGWEGLPVRVTPEGADWPETAGRPVRAAVSSFGISGTNAHVVLEGYAPAAPPAVAQDPVAPRLLPLSGRTEGALRELAGRYLDWLGAGERSPADLADAAWTAGTGRSHFARRAAVVFADGAELRTKLSEVALSGAAALPPADPESPVAAAAAAYVAGEEVAFAELFAGEERRRVSLPTYPFQRERHWAPPAPAAPREAVHSPVPGDRVGGFLYALDWREVEGRTASGGGPDPGPGTWLLAASGERGRRAAAKLAAWLEERGAAARLGGVAGGTEGGPRSTDRGAWRSLALELARETPLAGVVWLGGLEGRGHDADAGALREDLGSLFPDALALVQGLGDAGTAPRAGTWLVSRGGQVVGPEAGAGPLWAPALWGFGRTVGRELADLAVRLVDLDPLSGDGPEALGAELLAPGEEPEIALRGGRRWAPRLARLPAPPADPDPVLREDRSYLVTGGFGGIGLRVAGWLLERGGGAVILNGRRPPTAAEAEAIGKLGAGGAEVRVEIADVTDEDAVSRLVPGIGTDSGLPPLGGIIHCAGVLSDASVANLDWDRFGAVLWPKVLGAWNLHLATRERDLDLFVLFSSVSGIIGTPGQSNYAAANAFLDQLALHRRSLGLPGQAIQWGAWSGVGQAEAARGRIADRLSSLGAGWLTPEEGLRALGRLIREEAASAAAFSMDWGAFPQEGLPRPPMLAELVSGGQARAPTGELARRLRRIPAGERERLLLEGVREELQAVLLLPEPPPPDVGFFELGMDSLTAGEFRNRLNRRLGDAATVPTTAVFDHPDARRLARHLLTGFDPAEPGEAASLRFAPRGGESPVAIIGMACRFPGAARLAEFWTRLCAGEHVASRGRPGTPLTTADPEDPRPWGSYLTDVDRFDAAFFRIAPDEAQCMDPQQRLLLETTWHALEDANLPPYSLRGSRTAVYASVGAGGQEYAALIGASGRRVPALSAAVGNSAASASGRIAYVLGLEGPAVSVDAACSASLVALHQAVLGLERGDADLALAGGANVTLPRGAGEMFAGAGLLSADGRCRTFDAAANGYARGEGCGMLVLRRLADAEAAGDRILAVVRGSAVNQDGARAGMTVPRGAGQERVLAAALARAGIEPAEVDYLEAHGVASRLGDPIEVGAAAAVYGRGRPPDRPLLMGSVKTNIGHLEQAAGAAALIKTVLALRAGFIPPHLHFREPNPEVPWDRIAVRVASEGVPWPPHGGRPPRAGVSAFGLSGTNAHVVVEGYPPGSGGVRPVAEVPLDPAAEREPDGAGALPELPRMRRLYPLSARSPDALRALAKRHLEFLEEKVGEEVPETGAALADLAWTAGVGRSHLPLRAAVVFGGRPDLLEGLRRIRDGARRVGSPREGAKIAFVHAGEGRPWTAAGRGLYQTEPVARAVFDRCEAVFREERGRSLLAGMFGKEDEGMDPAWSQPARFALSAALGALWSRAGVEPDALLGYGAGEVAAAHAAGVFGLEEGLRFAARRGAALGEAPALLVAWRAEDAQRAVTEVSARAGDGALRIAADHGGRQIVAGPDRELVAFEREAARAGVRAERLPAGHGFHAALSGAALDALAEALPPAAAGAPRKTLVGGTTGAPPKPGERLDGAAWRRQAEAPVAFGAALASLVDQGVEVFVEIGPAPHLGPLIPEALGRRFPRRGAVLSSQDPDPSRPGSPDDGGFLPAVARLYQAGRDIAFEGLFAGERRAKVALPVYPFERQRHWVAPPKPRRRIVRHPLLGERRASGRGEVVFQTELSLTDPPWLRDCEVFGRQATPPALFAAQAVAAALFELPAGSGVLVEGLEVERPLVLPERRAGSEDAPPRTVQVVLGAPGDTRSTVREVRVFSCGLNDETWVRHAAARTAAADSPADAGDGAPPRRARKLPRLEQSDFYGRLREAGIEYGWSLRSLSEIRSGGGAAVAEVSLPAAMDARAVAAHPVLLDGCLQVVAAAAPAGGPPLALTGWERLWLSGPLPPRLRCRASVGRPVNGGGGRSLAPLHAEVRLTDAEGALLGEVRGLRMRRLAGPTETPGAPVSAR